MRRDHKTIRAGIFLGGACLMLLLGMGHGDAPRQPRLAGVPGRSMARSADSDLAAPAAPARRCRGASAASAHAVHPAQSGIRKSRDLRKGARAETPLVKRLNALIALRERTDPLVATRLLDYYLAEPDMTLRKMTLTSLAFRGRGDPQARSCLMRIAREESDQDLRNVALVLLRQIRLPGRR